jgi:hypothetical protein
LTVFVDLPDPVAVLHGYLRDHPAVSEVLGGVEHVSGINEAPWPHLSVTEAPQGDLRGLIWSAEHEVTLELVGDPTGAPGQAELWRMVMRLTQIAVAMPEDQDPAPGEPVVSRVVPSGTAAYSPMTNGQPRYVIGVLVTLRPADPTPAP